MHFRYRRRGGVKFGARVWIVLVLLAALGILTFRYVDRNMAPVIISMAEARVQAMAVRAMNDAIRTIMSDPDKYADLITYKQDNQGNVILVQADAPKLNDIAVSAAIKTQENISQIGAQGIGIPLGTVLGGQLLAGRGPIIYARIVPVGSVTFDYDDSQFDSEGINQTRLKIYLNLHTTVNIVIPTKTKSVDVSGKVLVTQFVIVGKVPNSYVNVPDPNHIDLNPDKNGTGTGN